MKLQEYGYWTKISFVRYRPYVADELTIKGNLSRAEVEKLVEPIGDIVGFWTTKHGQNNHYIRIMSAEDLEDHK